MNCLWISSTQPRVVAGRHEPACADDACPGCQRCTETHCVVCRRVHAVSACPECVGNTRDDIDQIREFCGYALRGEAATRGVDSEAFMLAGPAATPGDYERRKRLVVNGAIRAGEGTDEYRQMLAFVEANRDEQHPLWVLGTWETLWREHLDHPSDKTLTIPDAADYLLTQLTYMGDQAEPDFAQFATEIRGCRGHLQSILHDQNQGDRANVGCFECGGDLERMLTEAGFEDHWTCRRCRRRYTYAEYNFALRANLEAAAAKEAS